MKSRKKQVSARVPGKSAGGCVAPLRAKECVYVFVVLGKCCVCACVLLMCTCECKGLLGCHGKGREEK